MITSWPMGMCAVIPVLGGRRVRYRIMLLFVWRVGIR